MKIFQKIIDIKPRALGFHIITDEIINSLIEIRDFKSGLMNLFLQHTSAALSINENADPTVRSDFVQFFKSLVPENTALYSHTAEGPDDMTSHIKSSLIGASLMLPVSNGKPALGTWQGIYLCEFRNDKRIRKIVATIIGEEY